MTPERIVKNALKKWVKDNNLFLVSTPQVQGYGHVGFPDYILIISNGITIYIECKAGKRSLSPGQERVRLRLLKLGHYFIEFRNEDKDYKALNKILNKASNEQISS